MARERRSVLRAVALGCLLFGVSPLPAAELPPTLSVETTLSRQVGYRYLLFPPTDYHSAPDRRWPLLLFLHGAGERGDDIKKLAKHGPPKLLHGDRLNEAEKNAAALVAQNFLVLAPQCPAGKTWDEDALLVLIDEAVRSLRVDPARVYVTGISMGGYGTWSLLARAPERFAAMAPICGGGRTIEFIVAGMTQRALFRPVGVWAFHGGKDPTVPLDESERMIAACRRAGMRDLKLTVYPEAEHDSWTETYANAELYTWLLAQKRP